MTEYPYLKQYAAELAELENAPPTQSTRILNA